MELFEQAEHILKTALTAGNPAECIQNHFTIQGNDLVDKTTGKSFSLARRNIIIVGAGKATALMAKKVEEMILPVVQSVSGLISVKQGHGEVLSHIKILEASHPVPDVRGVQAAEEILDLLDNAEKDDLVIALFSGGGSALLPLPAQGISLEDIQQTTDLLLASGAEIDEINAVRKHISRVKGGNLMRAAFPATVITLLLSDVLGNKADVIASGPFSPDDSTFAGAVNVCEKYKIRARLPDSVGEYLKLGFF